MHLKNTQVCIVVLTQKKVILNVTHLAICMVQITGALPSVNYHTYSPQDGRLGDNAQFVIHLYRC